MQKQELETIINEQLALFKNLKEEFISKQQYEIGANLRGIEKYLIDIMKLIEEKKEQIPQLKKTPNFFEGNYSVGRFHTSMLAYIIELGNNGEGKELAENIFEGLLDFKYGAKYYSKFEYKNVDLVVFDDKECEKPILLIEMKVDDYESWEKVGDVYVNQLEIYNQTFDGHNLKKIYITLGIGQCAGNPSCKDWFHITLEKLVTNLEKDFLFNQDKLISDWFEILKKEKDLKKRIEANKFGDGDSENRCQIYRYGKLITCLQKRFIGKYNDCSAFMYGTRPDLILNFGYGGSPIYMEITNSLTLRIKINKDQLEREITKSFNDLLNDFRDTLGDKILTKTKAGNAVTIYNAKVDLNIETFFSTDFTDNILDKIEECRVDLEIMRKIIEE